MVNTQACLRNIRFDSPKGTEQLTKGARNTAEMGEAAETSHLCLDDTARRRGESRGATRLVSIVGMYCMIVSCLHVAACGAGLHKDRALRQDVSLTGDLAVRRQSLGFGEAGTTALNCLQVLTV